MKADSPKPSISIRTFHREYVMLLLDISDSAEPAPTAVNYLAVFSEVAKRLVSRPGLAR